MSFFRRFLPFLFAGSALAPATFTKAAPTPSLDGTGLGGWNPNPPSPRHMATGIPYHGTSPNQRQRRKARRRAHASGVRHAFA